MLTLTFPTETGSSALLFHGVHSLVDQELPGPFLSLLQSPWKSTDITYAHTEFVFNVGAGDSNLDPHTCMANSLTH